MRTFFKLEAEFLNALGLDLSAALESYRQVYFIKNKDNTVQVLKPLRVGAVQAFLTGDFLNWAESEPILPGLAKPPGGGFYFRHYGNRYFLTNKLPGREADYYDDHDLKTTIRLMARFHELSRGYLERKRDKWLALRYNPLNSWRRRLVELDACRRLAILSGDDWSRNYLKKWRFFSDQAFQALDELSGIKTLLPEVICYHDWAHHNILIDREDGYLVDFDALLVDQAVHDRANLLRLYLRLHRWSPRALLKAVWYFDQHYHWRYNELRLLRIYLSFPYDYWILGRQYFLEKQPWSKRYFQEQWQRKIETAQSREATLELLTKLE